MSTLDELLARIGAMTPVERSKAAETAQAVIASSAGSMPRWIPNPGPQTEAFFSLADCLLYGGQAGGGKSSLLCGTALTAHQHSLVIRRQFNSLSGLIEDLLKINGGREGFREAPTPRLRTPDDRLVELGACLNLGDEENYQGRPRDLLGIDEAAQVAEQQVRYLMGWNRTTIAGQRVRTILASNPPLSAEGEYLVKMFRPWLDLTHGRRAKPGELRWYITDPDGNDMEVPSAEPVEIQGHTYRPKSRTFIPAALADNPYLVNTDYQKELDAMPEPMRSAFRDGNFMIARKDQAMQIIPSAWIRAAQARWKPQRPRGAMSALGLDIAQGGDDNTCLAPRYDWWFGELVVVPGKETPSGREVAGLVVGHRRDKAKLVIDFGGGYAGGTFEVLRENLDSSELVAFKGAEKTLRKTRDKKFGFVNQRTALLWAMREGLDPEQDGGSPIALPPDPELEGDLAAPTYEVTARGIKAESAEDVKDKLGRSPDKGVAACLAWWSGSRGSVVEEKSASDDGFGAGRRRSSAPPSGPGAWMA
jgi:hypothetical protein